ncbi:MAG: regulatory protein FmdB family [Verrucomicrobia bacterium]|nr:regulatory protein FmdB family [Verrucomicrobiota bacterium]
MNQAGAHNRRRFPMPTYEYACPKCGHAFEHFQSMRDAPLTRCPKCRKLGVKRLVGSGAGLIFKGSGFYITDYKKSKAPEKTGGETAPAAKPDQPAKPAAPVAAK